MGEPSNYQQIKSWVTLGKERSKSPETIQWNNCIYIASNVTKSLLPEKNLYSNRQLEKYKGLAWQTSLARLNAKIIFFVKNVAKILKIRLALVQIKISLFIQIKRANKAGSERANGELTNQSL